MDTKSTNWSNEEGPTLKPLAASAELAEEIQSMTVGTVVGVVMVVLLAIGVVFTLGVMLDCRQQKILGKNVKRLNRRRRGTADVESEGAGIADHMEPSATSPPPAAALRPS